MRSTAAPNDAKLLDQAQLTNWMLFLELVPTCFETMLIPSPDNSPFTEKFTLLNITELLELPIPASKPQLNSTSIRHERVNCSIV